MQLTQNRQGSLQIDSFASRIFAFIWNGCSWLRIGKFHLKYFHFAPDFSCFILKSYSWFRIFKFHLKGNHYAQECSVFICYRCNWLRIGLLLLSAWFKRIWSPDKINSFVFIQCVLVFPMKQLQLTLNTRTSLEIITIWVRVFHLQKK